MSPSGFLIRAPQAATILHHRRSGYRNKRRGGVARVQKHTKAEEETIVFNGSSLTTGAVLVEKEDSKVPSNRINIIPNNGRWPNGVPPAMGGHFMSSGTMAPLSGSKGPGIDIHPMYFSYPQRDGDNNDMNVIVYENDFTAANGLADMIAEASKKSIDQKGSFVIALSGGSLVKSLASLVGRTDIDFSRWWVTFADERNVPLSSPDSNYRAAQEELLSKVPIPSSHVLTIKEGLPVNLAAEQYAGQLLSLPEGALPRTAAGFPQIDLILLGVGPDGHVASLFPNRKETAATEGWVLPVSESPKPPAERITLSMPVLNAARHVAIVALGEGKAEVVQRALEVQSLPGALPVQMVQPIGGKVDWILEKGSASSLSISDWNDKKKFPRSDIK